MSVKNSVDTGRDREATPYSVSVENSVGTGRDREIEPYSVSVENSPGKLELWTHCID